MLGMGEGIEYRTSLNCDDRSQQCKNRGNGSKELHIEQRRLKFLFLYRFLSRIVEIGDTG